MEKTAGDCHSSSSDTCSEPDVVELSRVLAISHHLIAGNSACSFLARYDPCFNELYQTYQPYGIVFALKLVAVPVFTLIVPFVYALYVMPYPCEISKVDIEGVDVKIEPTNCDAEDLLRSWFSLLLAPLVFVITLAAIAVFHLISQCAGKTGRKLLLCAMHIEFLTAAKIPKLLYHKYPQISAIVNQAYLVMILQMLVIGVYLRSAVAVILGYVAGEILLHIANFILAPSNEAIGIVDGKLTTWTRRFSGQQLFTRLRTLGYLADVTILTCAELAALHEELHNTDGQWQLLLSDVQDDRYYIASPWRQGLVQKQINWQALSLQTIYIPERNEFFKLPSPATSYHSLFN